MLYAEIKIKGTTDEKLKLLDLLKNNEHTGSTTINHKFIDLIHEEELNKLLEESKDGLKVESEINRNLPEDLSEIKLFEDIAILVPNTTFEGNIEGERYGTRIWFNAKYKDNNLHQTYSESVQCDNEVEAYIEYLHNVIPFDEFCKIFKLDVEEMDEEACEEGYEEFLMEGYIESIDYDDFLYSFEDATTSEEDFQKGMKKLIELGIQDYTTYSDTLREEDYKEWDFNPLKDIPKRNKKPAEIYAREISEKPDKIDFEGKIFVETCCFGSLDSIITDNGGIVKENISLKTDYIIIGDSITSKTSKIENAYNNNKNKNTNIIAITKSEFLKLIEK